MSSSPRILVTGAGGRDGALAQDARVGAGSRPISSQYSAGRVRESIESALRNAGRDPERLDAAELTMMEDFHTSGRLATAELTGLANISAGPEVLRPGGRLAIWDVTAGPEHPLNFPLPWADTPELSHLVTPEQLVGTIRDAGFAVAVWNDLTRQSAEFMRSVLAAPLPPLGLHVFVPEFDRKIANLQAGLEQHCARLIQAVMIAE